MDCNRKMSRSVRDIDHDVLELFGRYDWPGNVRELQHAIEHAMNVLPDDASVITPEYLPAHLTAPRVDAHTTPAAPVSGSLSGTMQDMERRAICKALRENGGNISESARVLQMSRQRLQYRIKRYKINIDALLENRRASEYRQPLLGLLFCAQRRIKMLPAAHRAAGSK